MSHWKLLLLVLLRAGAAPAEPVAESDLIDTSKPDEEVTLGPEDFAASHTEDDPDLSTILGDKDPTLTATKFEGDIAGFNATSIIRYMNENNDVGRNAIRNPYQRWPDGIIPYTLSSRYGPITRRTIARAMEEFHKRTCIRFKPRKSERHYVYIHPDDGCYSLVGRVGGRQPLSLDSGCIAKGTIMHELMHATGFFHEQSRADRDQYIEIIDDNLIPGAKDQFQKYSLREITHLGTKYDYGSIMHYSQYAFTRYPGRITIRAKNPSGQRKMGNRRDFSKNDIYKINKLYSCDEKIDETDIDTDGDGDKPDTPDCSDEEWNCKIRKYLGYCNYDRYTKENCKKSCDLCDSSSGGGNQPKPTDRPRRTTTRRAPRPEPGSGECENAKDKCSEWAGKGFCDKYTKYMRSNCPAACGLCGRSSGNEGNGRRRPLTTTTTRRPGTPAGTCKDKNHHCSDWASAGRNFCQKYPNYMKKNCAKSCGVCGQHDVNARSSHNADCRDRHRKCAQYEEDGYCRESHSQYNMMKRYCKKSCGLC